MSAMSEEFRAWRESVGLADCEPGIPFGHCKAIISRVPGSTEFKTCAKFTTHEVNGTLLCSEHTNATDVHWTK
jgi:hypothetical protein